MMQGIEEYNGIEAQFCRSNDIIKQLFNLHIKFLQFSNAYVHGYQDMVQTQHINTNIKQLV